MRPSGRHIIPKWLCVTQLDGNGKPVGLTQYVQLLADTERLDFTVHDTDVDEPEPKSIDLDLDLGTSGTELCEPAESLRPS